MKKLLLIIALCCLSLSASAALRSVLQVSVTGGGGGGFTGPGDAVSGANAWYGLRGYSTAYATGSNPAITVRCSSGPSTGSTSAINILSNGNLDIATASSLCGTDGVITATSATNVLSISAKSSGQVTIGDQITGAGFANPTFIWQAGTCTSGAVVPPCTFILSRNNTVSSGVTVTAAGGMFITQFNDQTGNGNTATATSGNQLPLLTNCAGSLPCLGSVENAATSIGYVSGTIPSPPAPFSFMAVAQRSVNSSGFPNLIGGCGGGCMLQWRNSTDTIGMYSGQLVTGTATDGVTHAILGIVTAAAGDILNVDNTVTNGTAITGPAFSGAICFPFNCGNEADSGFVMEGGLWPVAFNTTQQTNLCHNARLYWGTPGSC